MKTTRTTPPVKRSVVCALAILALTMGTARAAVSSPTAQRFSAHPVLSGTVVTANAHQLVVLTHKGEAVTLDLNSRTLVPRNGASPGFDLSGTIVASQPVVSRRAQALALGRPGFLSRTPSGALVLPLLGMFTLGTVGVIAFVRRCFAGARC